jgi:hypothetical protein
MATADVWLRQQVADAIADLSRRLGVSESEIEVARSERVVWRDGSLGCPRPGMRYTQALVQGTFIQLLANQTAYNYHGGRNGPPRLCESPAEVLPEDLPSNPAI